MTGDRQDRVDIELIRTGVPGLDMVLGGGLPAYSFNLIAGGPGAGKTTLTQQIMFANATPERPALYFTVLGEPAIKLLRYQQQFDFFRPELIGSAIHLRNLSEEVLQGDLEKVLDRIAHDVEEFNPGIVVVDSFRTMVRTIPGSGEGLIAVEHFVQTLALQLTSWEITSFLVGEYTNTESHNPLFTVADGILWLSQDTDRNSVVRKLQVVKMRGRALMPGLHTMRITGDGVQVFPRIPERKERAEREGVSKRLSTGIAGFDEMLGGGIPAGDSVMLVGPAGSGKTTMATQFIAAAIPAGEASVIAVFEEYPEEYLKRAAGFGLDLQGMIERGKLKVIYLRPLDLSVDETLQEIREWVEKLGATRVVIDSLSGFEVALAPTFRTDFRESLYRLVTALTGTGVTVLMTDEVVESYSSLHFTSRTVSFLADDLIIQRFAEIEGELKSVLTVVKMRGSRHSKDLRMYEVTPAGAVFGDVLRDYRSVLSGSPVLQLRTHLQPYPGLTDQEALVLDALIKLRGPTVEEIEARIGMVAEALAAALERLVELDYAVRLDEDGETIYRAIARVSRI